MARVQDFSVENKRISNSNITKTIKIFKKMPSLKVREFYLVYIRFPLKRLRSKLQKLRIVFFLDNLFSNWRFLSFLIHLKNVFRQSLPSKNSPEYPETTDML